MIIHGCFCFFNLPHPKAEAHPSWGVILEEGCFAEKGPDPAPSNRAAMRSAGQNR